MFGKKNSRLKKIKVYGKAAEVRETIKDNARKSDGELLNEVYTPELLEFAEGLIRWEASLYHRYLERLSVPTLLKEVYSTDAFSPEKQIQYWKQSVNDLMTSLVGKQMKLINDNEIHQSLLLIFTKTSEKTGKASTALADSAYRTYRDIRRDGWQITRDLMTDSCGQHGSFNRHIRMLTECGLSRAALQNMSGLDDGAQIIPFVRFIEVDFGAQYPDWYVQPPPKFVYTPAQTARLSLVA